MSKRSADDDGDAPAQKVPRPDEDTWTCVKCGNLNYGGRMFCNMRKCGAPNTALSANWICPGCGNENFAGKLFCNLRRCGLAKPGLTLQTLAAFGVDISGLMGPGNSDAAKPNWHCLACGNSNFPSRDQCNGRGCGKPRSEVDGGPGIPGGLQGLKDYSNSPEGSWMCRYCKNVNFPTRLICNGKNCGRSRSDADGGAPPKQIGIGASAPAMPVPQPSGKLTGAMLTTMANAIGAMMGNVPAATSSPVQLPTQVAGGGGRNEPVQGSWKCGACGNVNFPTRSICAKRTCGLPRPADD
eukprot:TRINITY_DN9352_c1_g1_i1.p1 TRINITY_DN9352_c1_g1~~TRINITY_DN9352_c1_g1_i1.p1  ORF type:complete len:297 (-),score=45.08 TRINITY_DN9352_c1_g1_i1:97-987(-)